MGESGKSVVPTECCKCNVGVCVQYFVSYHTILFCMYFSITNIIHYFLCEFTCTKLLVCYIFLSIFLTKESIIVLLCSFITLTEDEIEKKVKKNLIFIS